MKIKLITIVAVIAIGLLVLVMTISSQASVENSYASSLAAARANAENKIPYNAYHYYQEAFQIHCEDEAIFKEYVAQAELLGENFHLAALEEYVSRFPTSAEAYERLCVKYHELERFKDVMAIALQSRANNAATSKIGELYNECAFMLDYVIGGFEEANSFLGNYALVKAEGKYGIVALAGEYMLAPTYEDASPMMGSHGAVNDGEEWHIINIDGFKVARTTRPVDYLGIMTGAKMPAAIGGKYCYVTNALIIPEELPYDYASNFKGGVAAVKKGSKWALVDAEENLITDYVFDDVILDEFDTCCNGGVILVRKDGKVYMVDTTGNRITEQTFEDAKPFVGSEYGAVCIDGKWGFVDTAGNVVIQPQYENADSFNMGIGAVCSQGLWGYVDSSGTLRIDYQFEDCKPFMPGGVAAVKENGFWKYVQLLPYT